MDICRNRVASVVVTYRPEVEQLSMLLKALRESTQWLIIVDNGSAMDLGELMDDDDVFIPLHDNLGLAAAQNIGIERALQLGAEFVYLSDQDSMPYPGMVEILARAFRKSLAEGLAVAAVGPVTIDERTGISSFWVVDRQGWPSRYRPQSVDEDVVDVGFLIASGSLLSSSAIRTLGGMRSSYFIDHIDTEWCLRARASGFRLLGVPSAKLQHCLGDEVRRVWFFGWRQVMTHSPLRDYYMFRNTLQMLRDVPMSAKWRAHFLWRLVQFAVYFLIFSGERLQRARMMACGLRHGIRGVNGRLSPASFECVDTVTLSLDPRPENVEPNRHGS